jgi:hypothetical protein
MPSLAGVPGPSKLPAARLAAGLGLAAGADPENGDSQPARPDRVPAHHEDLPYKVELWDPARQSVEQVLAVTAHGSIGYAAYYAATREYPDRYVTLRHKNRIVSRWNAPGA